MAEFSHQGAAGDLAGDGGLLQEGFGVGSFYVPNRRLNERLEVMDTIQDRPVVQYSYDCDGPNIRGLHVTRTMEPLPDEASVRVTWRIENRGEDAQWVAPWVDNDLAPGGKADERDRLDLPTFEGIRSVSGTQHYPAARNWWAATDPIEQLAVYGVFNADQTYAFFAKWDPANRVSTCRTTFVPRVFEPGTAWETVYRLNVARGTVPRRFRRRRLRAPNRFQGTGRAGRADRSGAET